MVHAKACIAIVVTASQRNNPKKRAITTQQLTDAKIEAGQDALRECRHREAAASLVGGMKVLYHQGGSPKLYDGKIKGVGRMVAAGLIDSITDLVNLAGVNRDLLAIEQEVFPGAKFTGLLTFRDVRRLTHTPLTGSVLDRSPRQRENFIVTCSDDPEYEQLQRIWADSGV